MRALSLALLVVFISGLIACDGDDFKSYSELKDLRVLALVADMPEINSPQTVKVSPYISYPLGGETDLEVSYQGCIDPGIAFGEDLECIENKSLEFFQGEFSFATNAFGPNKFSGFLPDIDVVISQAAFDFLKAQSPLRQYSGIDYLIIMSIKDQKNPLQTVKSFKRISLTTKPSDLNTNPSIEGAIQGAGQNLMEFPGKLVELKLSGLSTAESYQILNSEGLFPVEEVMTVTWFSDVGEFASSKTAPERSVTYDPKGKTQGLIVAVYRDNRGGAAVVDKILPAAR